MTVVENKAELLSALASAGNGTVIDVKDNASIDLSGEPPIGIPGGVTFLSRSALLFSDDLDTFPLFKTLGPDVRISGLRLRGPDPDVNQATAGSPPYSEGIQNEYAGLEVDNNEIWGWQHTGVSLRKGSVDAYIHHNNIHHRCHPCHSLFLINSHLNK